MARIINIVFRTLVNDHVTLLFWSLLFFVNSCRTTIHYYSHLWVICHTRPSIVNFISDVTIIKLHALENSTKLLISPAKHFSKHYKAKNHRFNACICFNIQVSYCLCYNGTRVGMIYWTHKARVDNIAHICKILPEWDPVIVQSIII